MDEMTWVGFDNYTRLIHDDAFWNALLNTVTIGLISTVPQLLIALGLAHLLHYKLRGATFWRVSLLMPYATSVAAATIVFAMLFGRDFGLINWFLGVFGFDNIDWENGRWTSQIAISVIVTWRWTGYNALIYLAAMQAIPKDLYEAAEVDGASRWQQLRHVTIPASSRRSSSRSSSRRSGRRSSSASRCSSAAPAGTGAAQTTSTRPSASSSTSRGGSTSSSAGQRRRPGRCS